MGNPGDFWAAETRQRSARGDLTLQTGRYPEVALDGPIVDSPCEVPQETSGGFGVALSVRPDHLVESFLPITIHGQLDTSTRVTLLTARNHGGTGRFGLPNYRANIAVFGAWVAGTAQLYSAIRFRLNAAQVLAHLQPGQSALVDDDGSALSVDSDETGMWLVYSCAQAATLRQLQERVVMGVLVLTQLAIDSDETAAQAVQVRIDPDGPWLRIHTQRLRDGIHDVEASPLLAYEELTIDRLASWIATNDGLDGLAWPVAKQTPAPLQEQAMVSTSLVEGLHRRLPFQHTKFLGATKRAVRNVRQAAVAAAVAQAAREDNLDPDLVSELMAHAVGHLGDVSFQDRADAIVAEVTAIVPEFTEVIPDIATRIKKTRNDFAHHLVYKEAKEPLADRYLRWTIVAVMTPWILRALLLLRAGIDPETLHARLAASERFSTHLAEVTRMRAELDRQV